MRNSYRRVSGRFRHVDTPVYNSLAGSRQLIVRSSSEVAVIT